MNILIVSNIPPWVVGGAEIQALQLAEQFAAKGHKVLIAGQLIPKGFALRQVSTEVEFIHIPFFRHGRLLRAISFSLGLISILIQRRSKFDIVYCRFLREAAIVIGALKKFGHQNFPVVACTEGAGESGCANFLRRLPFQKTIVKIFNTSINRINIISPAIGEELKGFGLREPNFSFVPNGTRLQKESITYTDSPVRSLVCVSRLASNKGIADLLYALKLAISEGIELNLTVIGDGPERDNLTELARKNGIMDIVHFLGNIEHKEVLNHLLNHQLFVLPSWNEGFSTAVIEAMSVGMAVIVTRSGGPEYFVDDTVGRVCEIKDVLCLAHKIVELVKLDPKALFDMGKSGRERVKKRFEISAVADQYLELFDSLIELDRRRNAVNEHS